MEEKLGRIIILLLLVSMIVSSFPISSFHTIPYSMKGIYRENTSIIFNKTFPCGSAGPLIGMLLEKLARIIGSYHLYPSFPCGSAGPLIGMLLEKWARIIGSYHLYPRQYQEFEIIRQMITDEIDYVNITIVDGNGNGNYTSIQQAIDNANPGDAILVYSGIYNEELFISKPLWVIGIGREFSSGNRKGKPIINHNDSSVTVSITADNVTLYGFTINGYIGVDIKANNTEIWGNNIYVHLVGVKATGNNSMFSYNAIISNDAGLKLEDAYNMNISWNAIEALEEDLHLENVSSSMILMNTLSNSILGIYIGEKSTDNTLKYNNFIGDKQNVLCRNMRNKWERNYWSDYNGSDDDNDGIGDTPYNSSNIVDSYPLINPFHDNPPDKPRINPDEIGILCGKTDADIPFYCLFNDPDDDKLYCKWVWGDNSSRWLEVYGNDIPFEITNKWDSNGRYIVNVIPIYVIIRDQYGLFNVSNPYEIHIYDLTAIKNIFIRRIIDLFMPTYFLSGWH